MVLNDEASHEHGTVSITSSMQLATVQVPESGGQGWATDDTVTMGQEGAGVVVLVLMVDGVEVVGE